MRRYHFISGLPRSGTTLLSSILKQNPRFTSSISDPLAGYIDGIITNTEQSAGMATIVSIPRRQQIMRDLVDSFYTSGNEVCFNTNRGWTANTALLKTLYPDFRMIVCVREIPWILDSFEQLHQKNPLTLKPLYHHQNLGTVYDRSHMLMGGMPNFVGYVSGPLANLKQSMYCNERNQLLYVEYDTLVKYPSEVMNRIYAFLQEPVFDHDFNNVSDSYDEFDESAKIIGLHTVKKKVEFKQRQSILPPDLYKNYEHESLWINNSMIKSKLNWITIQQSYKQL